MFTRPALAAQTQWPRRAQSPIQRWPRHADCPSGSGATRFLALYRSHTATHSVSLGGPRPARQVDTTQRHSRTPDGLQSGYRGRSLDSNPRHHAIRPCRMRHSWLRLPCLGLVLFAFLPRCWHVCSKPMPLSAALACVPLVAGLEGLPGCDLATLIYKST